MLKIYVSEYKNLYISLSFLREKSAKLFWASISLVSYSSFLFPGCLFSWGSKCPILPTLNHLPFDEGPSMWFTDGVLNCAAIGGQIIKHLGAGSSWIWIFSQSKKNTLVASKGKTICCTINLTAISIACLKFLMFNKRGIVSSYSN